MMNAKDAAGLQEDLAIINARRQPQSSPEPLHHPDESGNAFAAMAMALRARDDKITELVRQLNDTKNSLNDVVASARAYREVVDLLIGELAEAKQVPTASVRLQAYGTLSRRYDSHVTELQCRGLIVHDMRSDPKAMSERDWYQPPAP